MWNGWLILLVGASVITRDGANEKIDLCSYQCSTPKGTFKHYACGRKIQEKMSNKSFTFPYGAKECKVTYSLSPAERKDILKNVNDLRNDVASGKLFKRGGENLRLVQWDHNLEYFAKVMATNDPDSDLGVQKLFKPWYKDMCAPTTDLPTVTAFTYPDDLAWRKIPVKEMFRSITGEDIPDDVILHLPKPESLITDDDWLGDIPPDERFGPPQLPGGGEPGGGDREFYKFVFTMLVSANASRIGCAYGSMKCTFPEPDNTVFESLPTPTVEFHRFYCFMGSGANVVNAPVFKFGDPCGSCPKGTICGTVGDWPNLCAPPGVATDHPGSNDLSTYAGRLLTGFTCSIHRRTPITFLITIVAALRRCIK